MNIEDVIWLNDIVDKIGFKHHVRTYEVEEALNNNPKIQEDISQSSLFTKRPERHLY